MKKILIMLNLIVMLFIMVGCGAPKTKTIKNLEYVNQVIGRYDKIYQFKDVQGNIHNFYVERNMHNFYVKSNNLIFLQQGHKYDVTVTIEDNIYYGDFIVDIKEAKSE